MRVGPFACFSIGMLAVISQAADEAASSSNGRVPAHQGQPIEPEKPGHINVARLEDRDIRLIKLTTVLGDNTENFLLFMKSGTGTETARRYITQGLQRVVLINEAQRCGIDRTALYKARMTENRRLAVCNRDADGQRVL